MDLSSLHHVLEAIFFATNMWKCTLPFCHCWHRLRPLSCTLHTSATYNVLQPCRSMMIFPIETAIFKGLPHFQTHPCVSDSWMQGRKRAKIKTSKMGLWNCGTWAILQDLQVLRVKTCGSNTCVLICGCHLVFVRRASAVLEPPTLEEWGHIVSNSKPIHYGLHHY
jgi:hypothetical protein